MDYSENLGLPILTDVDTLTATFTQGNGIVNQLEEVLGEKIDDINEIPTMRTDIADLDGDIENLDNKVEVLEHMQNKETVKINNVDTEMVKHIVKLEANTVGDGTYTPYSTVDLEHDDSNHRLALFSRIITCNINLTSNLGIINVNDIILKSCLTYQNEYKYMGQYNAIPMQVVCIGNLPNQSDITLFLENSYNRVVAQTKSVQQGVDVWTPPLTTFFDANEPIIVVLEYYTYA